MIRFSEDRLSVAEYLGLRESVGWKKLTVRQAELALENCIYCISAYDQADDGTRRLIGMGRIVGDGAVICYIQDLIVLPEYHHRGVGSALIKHLKNYVSGLKSDGEEMMLALMCAKGREGFYEHNGFTARPTENLGPGMIIYLK
ncbi:MAG: GNAT family N-acetyltransferase [Eubacterium sp.]|nr:GNAT family N-acetyltransferase [Eubacterium sp.]